VAMLRMQEDGLIQLPAPRTSNQNGRPKKPAGKTVLNEFACFALKGGTAINLFVQDMPRLSVDIDLTYLPVESRDIFLLNIEAELLKMKQLIENKGLVVKVVQMKISHVSVQK
jgi:hypothetical protein